MKKLAIAFSLLVATLFFGSTPAKAQPQPVSYFVMSCNINGQIYNIDQNGGIYGVGNFYVGQLVRAATPSGWIAVRVDGVQFPVFSCQ